MVWERTRSDDVLELEVGVELVHFRAGKGDAHENLQAGNNVLHATSHISNVTRQTHHTSNVYHPSHVNAPGPACV